MSSVVYENDDKILTWGELLSFLKTLSKQELKENMRVCDAGGADVWVTRIKRGRTGNKYLAEN